MPNDASTETNSVNDSHVQFQDQITDLLKDQIRQKDLEIITLRENLVNSELKRKVSLDEIKKLNNKLQQYRRIVIG
jgi:hypothetical protein